ncbi:MAG: hypothetical protein KatS3mg011_1633 [Acidimicrobiia bacterium]|nr:MAG: hypothetical protein KatS3mg011_1633 [Acidimicrobiia bacterium]
MTRKLVASEELIVRYAGVRVRLDLDRPEAPLWEGDHISVRKLWSYYCQLLYMPRLARFEVLADAIADGVGQINWTDTFAYAESYDETVDRYLGLTVGQRVALGPAPSHTAVLVKPERAASQLEAEREETTGAPAGVDTVTGPPQTGLASQGERLPTRFYGRKTLDPVRAIREFGDLCEEVVKHLEAPTGSRVTITVEINAESDGYNDQVVRIVRENAAQLRFDDFDFEE